MRMHHRHSGGAVLVLPAQLDLLAASRLAEIVRAARGAPLAIDASGVERLGASCAQALRAATIAWRRDGAHLTIERPSPAFLDDLALLGIAPDSLDLAPRP